MRSFVMSCVGCWYADLVVALSKSCFVMIVENAWSEVVVMSNGNATAEDIVHLIHCSIVGLSL